MRRGAPRTFTELDASFPRRIAHARQSTAEKPLMTPSTTSTTSSSNGIADPIDVVITWVDGRDPKHRTKRNRYLANLDGNAGPERVASKDRRFSDNEEIRFACARSAITRHGYARSGW
jgi:hypothetical protein